MSRRTGKAATRRARQQRRARQGPSVPAPVPAPVVGEPSVAEQAVAEQDDRAASPATPSRPAVAYASASSNLGESGRHEYHYVMSDLRNTAILVVVMAALLAAAVVIVNLAG